MIPLARAIHGESCPRLMLSIQAVRGFPKTTQGLDGQHQYVDRTPVEESIRMTEDSDK